MHPCSTPVHEKEKEKKKKLKKGTHMLRLTTDLSFIFTANPIPRVVSVLDDASLPTPVASKS